MKRLLPLILAIASVGAAEPVVIELSRPGEPLRIALDGREFEVAKGGKRTRVAVAEGTPAAMAGQAAALADARPGARVELVGRLVDSAGQGTQRAVITRQVAVRLPEGATAEGFCAANGLRPLRVLDWAPGYVLAEPVGNDPLAAVLAEQRLRSAGHWAEAQVRVPIAAYAVPNDPFYNTQWHLTAAAGIGINIAAHWAGAGPYYTGAGQNIAVVDSGLDLTHEDLVAGVRTDIDVDVYDGDLDPSHGAVATDSGHGTVVAGLIGARANNGVGVAGVAYNASLVGVRLVGPSTMAASIETSTALAHRATATSDVIAVSNNSWGPVLNGTALGSTGSLVDAALQAGTTSGRNGRGTIFVFAAGNGYPDDRADFNAFASNRRAIAVGATGITGVITSYSERGVGILISAPGGGDGTSAMVSTDWTDSGGRRGFQTGSYTEKTTPIETPAADSATGTSFAAPLVAGTAALLLEVNPRLSWRDVPWILMLSARAKTGASHVTNRAGRGFDLDYGAGLLDVSAALALAATWTPLPPETSYTATAVAASATLNDTTSASKTFSFDPTALTGFVVERAVVTLNLTHPLRGDVKFVLRAPDRSTAPVVLGTAAPISGRPLDTNADLIAWPFTSVWTMGESGGGDWTLTATDTTANSDGGTLDACSLTLYGYKPYSAPAIVRIFPSAIEDDQTNVRVSVDATTTALSQGRDLLGSLQANAASAAVATDEAGWPSATFNFTASVFGNPPINVTLVNPQVRQANTLALGGGGASNIATIAVRAAGTNLAPVAAASTPATLVAGFTTTVGAVSFSDPESDTLRYRISVSPTKGTATINILTGVVTYAPSLFAIGADSITVEATDGMDPSTSTIAYTVERNVTAGLTISGTTGGSGGGGGSSGGCGAGAGGAMGGLVGIIALLALRRRRR